MIIFNCMILRGDLGMFINLREASCSFKRTPEIKQYFNTQWVTSKLANVCLDIHSLEVQYRGLNEEKIMFNEDAY